MVCLGLPNDQVTMNPAEMRKLATEFYANIFLKDTCDEAVAAELLQLTSEDQAIFNTESLHLKGDGGSCISHLLKNVL